MSSATLGIIPVELANIAGLSNISIASAQTQSNDLTSIPRYADGPCKGQSPGNCKFDSRTVATVDGRLIESITAYGKYWNFDINNNYQPVKGSGSDLNSVSRYANGPCQGKAPGSCTFDSRTISVINNRQLESITAYGKFWIFDIKDNYKLVSGGNDLTSVSRYANGPCKGKAPGSCSFDSRTVRTVGGRLTESITAYGKYWNFDVNNNYQPLSGNGSDLNSVSRYANGPCQGKAAGSCTFDSRTIATIDGRRIESITAYGKFWNFEEKDW